MIDKLNLPYAISLKKSLLLLAEQAASLGAHDAYKVALEIATSLDDARHVQINIKARDIFAASCDYLRANDMAELAEKINKLCLVLRSENDRKVIGSLNFNAQTLAQVDDVLEGLHKRAKQLTGG